MDRLELGRMGEEEAVRYLMARGWDIVGRNVRWGRREVDIIASRELVLAFVEVKCRRGRAYGHPLEAINRGKRQEIARVAKNWLRGRILPAGTLIRFDAISVLCQAGGRWEVLHLPDAWRLD